MKEGNGFIWENKAGVSWSLWPTTNPKVFQVTEDCPYFDVYQSVEFELDSDGAKVLKNCEICDKDFAPCG